MTAIRFCIKYTLSEQVPYEERVKKKIHGILWIRNQISWVLYIETFLFLASWLQIVYSMLQRPLKEYSLSVRVSQIKMSINVISNYTPHQSPSKLFILFPCSINSLYIIVIKQKKNRGLFSNNLR